MTTPDYVEAPLNLPPPPPDGAAPVFHMVRLPDSVVFVQAIKRANSYIRSPRLVGDWRLKQRLLAIASILHGPIMTKDTGMFSLQRAATMVKHRKIIVLSTPNKEHVIGQNTSIAASV